MIVYYTFKCYKDYEIVFDIIKEKAECINPRNKLHKKDGRNITYAFAAYGIQEIVLQQDINYRLYIELRPKLMIEPGNYDDVLRAYDILLLYKRFKNIMNDLGLSQISNLQVWHVKRIDYAVDIVVPQMDIPMYIKLFHRGNIRETLLNSDTSRRYEDADNNLYLTTKNCCVNFYDRYTTSVDKQKKNPNKYENIEERYSILRFEIQLKNIDTSKLKKRKFIKNNTVDDFLNIDLCKYYILKYYNEIIGRGDYYSYYDALGKCKNVAQKEVMRLAYHERSVYRAKQAFINQGDDKRKRSKKFSKIINDLERLGINPVTTEDRYIKNLYSKLLYAIDGSNKILIKRRKKYCEE